MCHGTRTGILPKPSICVVLTSPTSNQCGEPKTHQTNLRTVFHFRVHGPNVCCQDSSRKITYFWSKLILNLQKGRKGEGKNMCWLKNFTSTASRTSWLCHFFPPKECEEFSPFAEPKDLRISTVAQEFGEQKPQTHIFNSKTGDAYLSKTHVLYFFNRTGQLLPTSSMKVWTTSLSKDDPTINRPRCDSSFFKASVSVPWAKYLLNRIAPSPKAFSSEKFPAVQPRGSFR